VHQAGQRVGALFVDARPLTCHAGVVDQRGQRAHLALGPLEHRRDVARRRHIRAYRDGSPAAGANGGDHRVGTVSVRRVVDDHAVPVVGQLLGDRGADPPAGVHCWSTSRIACTSGTRSKAGLSHRVTAASP
jgi:hypothetical protein